MSKLRTKDITYDNHQAINEYFAEDRRSRILTGLSFMAMRYIYNPKVTFAEGAREQLSEDLASGARMIVAPNHLRYIDHLVLAGGFRKTKPLKEIASNSFIWGKLEHFQDRANRYLCEKQGTLPVIRRQDVPEEISDFEFGKMQPGLFRNSIGRLALGQHATIFGEGTRNKGTRPRLMELEPGIGILARKAIQKGVDVRVLLAGLAYDQDNWRGASIYVGRPIDPHGKSISQINTQIQHDLQECVLESFAVINPEFAEAA